VLRKISVVWLVILAAMAVSPSLFTSHSPFQEDLMRVFQSPDSQHLLGCDALGRDLYARLVFGARQSLTISTVVAFLSILFPLLVSSLILFRGGLWNQLYLMTLDVFLAFPPLLLAILIVANQESSGFAHIVFALFLSSWASNGRILRSYLLELKSSQFVEAAIAMGASSFRIYWVHIFVNLWDRLVLLWALRCASILLAEATLSFLGLGGGPEMVSWGWLVMSSKDYLTTHPLLSILPATMIALTVFSFQVIGRKLFEN